MASRSGKFVALEGIDSVGKSTYRDRLHADSVAAGHELVVVSDPPMIPPWENLRDHFQ